MNRASCCALAALVLVATGCDPLGTCLEETQCQVNLERSACEKRKGEFHADIGHAGASVCKGAGFTKTSATDIGFTFEKGGTVTYTKP